MKLDVNTLRYLQHDEWRTLTAVEIGQKNVRHPREQPCVIGPSTNVWQAQPDVSVRVQHEIVPTQLIETIAKLRCACCRPVQRCCLQTLTQSHSQLSCICHGRTAGQHNPGREQTATA